MPLPPNFFEDVYEVVRQVPPGRVTTYGAVASFLGLKSSARMVGWALNHAIAASDVPAHRVVNRKGLLTGKYHFSDSGQMEALLQAEGVAVESDVVVDFEEKFWDPSQALQL